MLAALRRFRFTEFQLLVVPSLLAIVGLLTIFLTKTHTLVWTWSDISISLVYIALVFLVTIGLSFSGFRGDEVLFPIVAMLAGVGLLVMQRLQILGRVVINGVPKDYGSIAERQTIYIVISFVLFMAALAFVRRLDWIARYKYTWAFIGIGLMLVTIALGVQTNGARLWLSIGPVTIQPDEILKVVLVIFFAAYLSEHQYVLASTYRIGPVRIAPPAYLVPMVIMLGLSMLAVMVQNDLGSALLLFGIFVVMLYVATGRPLYVVLLLAAFAIGVFLIYHSPQGAKVAIRVQNWINPWADPSGRGYQAIQSGYAMSAGHLFGGGLAHGYPQYIPVVESDYVFAIIGEELGLFGTIAVLCLYLLLVGRGFIIALRAEDGFARLLATGLTTVLALQTLIILGGVVRLIPLTGVTLPFISSGGSSLLTNFIIIALLLRASDPEWRRG